MLSKTYNLPDRFVTIPPLLNLKDKKIKYTDLLIYAALKSYNSQYANEYWFRNRPYEDGCFPSLATIAGQAGVAKGTVIAAIKRLEAAKFITINRSVKLKVANHYWFPELSQTYTIPYRLFRTKELTSNEKAMLICIRQFYIGEDLNCMFTEVVKEIAKHLGVSYNTVYTQYNSLVKKGYVIDKKEIYKKDYQRRVIQLSDKLNWIFKADVEPDYSTMTLKFK